MLLALNQDRDVSLIFCLDGETICPECPLGGGQVLSDMADVFVWGIVVALVAIAVGAGSEGRFQHGLRLLLGMAPRKESFNVYDDVPRPGHDWRLVERFNDPNPWTGEIDVRHTLFIEAPPVAAEAAPHDMPPTIKPRRREPVPSSH